MRDYAVASPRRKEIELGLPAGSVPVGHSGSGSPVGLHVVGSRHADDVVLRLARVLEQVRPWLRPAPSS